MKNKVVLFILAVALFIPSFVAITSYTRAQSSPVNEKTITKMVIADLNGTEHIFERLNTEDDSAKMIDFFVAMNRRASETTGLPDALVGQQFFMVTLSTVTKDRAYQYYFSSSSSDSYFTDPDGNTYKIAEADASSFLETKYASSIYKQSEFPSMLLSEQYNVKPYKAVWNYKNHSGNYTAANLEDMITDEVKEYRLEGGFDFKFSLEPDLMSVKVVNTANGDVLYDDTYENMSTLSFAQSTIISVEIKANWYQDETREYYGESYYSFKTTVSAPAEFYLAKPEIEQGGFVVLSGKNVSNPDKVILKSEPSIEYEPKFYTEGEYVHAIIPISMELAHTSYIFSVTYGGVTQEMTLSVTPKTVQTRPYDASQTIVNNYYSEAAQKAYNDAFKEITSTTSSERLWKGDFLEIFPSTALKLGFGHMRQIGNGVSFRMTGVDYVVASGKDVLATNDGIVVYKDVLDFSGYTVVIDHGWGLKSWYSHLSGSDVMVGDTVTKGSKIGSTGNTGFTSTSGVYFGLTVGNVPVSPYKTWPKGNNGDGGDGGVLVHNFES